MFTSLASGNKDIIFQVKKKEISQLSQKKKKRSPLECQMTIKTERLG